MTGPIIHIPFNVPVRVAVQDPDADFDFERAQTTYHTTDGRLLVLPRPAVIALNELAPAAGQLIEIVRSWTGKPADSKQWEIRFASEQKEPDPAPLSSRQNSKPQPAKAEHRPAPQQQKLF